MQTELGMNATNNAYTIVSLVFFFTYAIFQAPATVAIREIGPRIFLTTIIFAWGVVMIVSTTRAALSVNDMRSNLLKPRGRASVSFTPGRSWLACV
jgi:hypothetical protein